MHINDKSFSQAKASPRLKTIMICDSNPVLAEGIASILRSEPYLSGFQLVTNETPDVLNLTRLAPDYLIVDPWQCMVAGQSVADAFAQLMTKTSLIAYCPEISAAQARVLNLAGFRAVMPKTVQIEELVRIVITVAIGGVYLHECYTEQTLSTQLAQTSNEEAAGLTNREAEVLRHVALGSSMKEIATLLHISSKTVDTYKTRANHKLNLRSRSDIVRYAIASGWMN